jgi:hypothetical protein
MNDKLAYCPYICLEGGKILVDHMVGGYGDKTLWEP